jgi:exonuclease VII large subunit
LEQVWETEQREAREKAEEQAAKQKNELEAELKSAQDRLNHRLNHLQELTAAKIAELQSEIEVQKLEASMNLFYAMMNPDKLALVPKLARKFAKQDKMLSAELQKNYNGLDLSSNLETLLKEAKVEKELAGLKDRLRAQAQEQERAQAQIANLEKTLSESKSKLEGLRHSFQALEQRCAALQQQLTAAQVHCTHVRTSAHAQTLR